MLTQFRSILAFTAIAALACISVAQAAPVTNNRLLHFDAGAGVTTDGSGNVSQWTNQAMDAHHAAQGNSTYQPLLTTSAALNNQPVLRFSGEVLVVPHHTDLDIGRGAGRQQTMFIVYETTAATGGRELINKSSGAASAQVDWRVYYDGDRLTWGTGTSSDSGAWWHIHDAVEPNVPQILAVDLAQTGEQSGIKNVWLDGVPQGPRGYTSKAIAQTHPVLIGAYDTSAGRAHQGDIAEIIAYDRRLNTVERRLVENYLSAKYDLSLAGKLYTGDTAANGHYDFNVFGIGKEVDGVTASPGKNFSQGLILSENTLLTDGQYLLAGDQKLAHGWTTDDVPSGVLERWNRDWFVTSVGGVLDAKFTFDFDDAGLTYDAAVPYDLLFRSDTNGTFERMNLTGTFDSNQLTFIAGNAPLQDGSYTLAIVPEPTSLMLLALGALALLLVRRRRGKE